MEASAKKYVDSIKGLIGHPEVTTDDAKRAEKMMSDFIANDGAKLHQLLVENDQQNSHTSFIYDMWGETYLSDRRPLPMTHNPSIVWCLHKNKGYCQLEFALFFDNLLKNNTVNNTSFSKPSKKLVYKLYRLCNCTVCN